MDNILLSDETKAIMCGKEYHFMRKHIFINFNFEGLRDPSIILEHRDRHIAKDHNVHIYMSIDNFIDESLHEFISKCKDVTDRIVTIHISKRYKFLLARLKPLLTDLNNYQIIVEKHSTVSLYRYNNDEKPTYLGVYYAHMLNKTDRVRTEFTNHI